MEDQLFAHWPVDADALRRLLPDAVRLQTHEGTGWLGITPYRVGALRLRGTLPLPRVSSFLELDVRTYVTAGGKPGIWFFSLDASSRFAVEAARRTYKLPYFQARISTTRHGEWLELESARAQVDQRRQRLDGDALLRELLDVADQPVLARLGECDRNPFATGASGPADAMDVRVGCRRNIVVDDVREVLDVESTRGDIGGEIGRASCRERV